MNSAGTLKVSKNISAAFSLFRLGFKGASVSNTGCYNTISNYMLLIWQIHTDVFHIISRNIPNWKESELTSSAKVCS